LGSVVKEHQRRGHLDDVVLSTSPLISVLPSTAPPTTKTIDPVRQTRPRRTDWLTTRTPTPTIGANALVWSAGQADRLLAVAVG
jgi:hypothetical protein